MKKYISLLLVVLMLAGLGCTAFAEQKVDAGQTMPDFTVSLTDGTTATLSELLKENKLVVLNIFATWCGPCEREFPEMEESFQAHQDEMVILSLSGDPEDSMEKIAAYKDSHGLSFPMGQAGDIMNFFTITGYPTTFFIDRSGMIAFSKVGAFVEAGSFEEKVVHFLSDDYDGQALPSEAVSPFASLFTLGGLVLAVLVLLLLVIGRWLLFRKAGVPGWNSLIPLFSTVREFQICWSAAAGVGMLLLCAAVGGSFVLAGKIPVLAENLIGIVCGITLLVMRVMESVKLSKAFGKGVGVGILLILFYNLGRFILGVSKAKYTRGDVNPAQ